MSHARVLLSACIIARDEAATLPRCIASLEGLCDEIRVLDTGSRDATVSVARSLGAFVDSDTSCNGDDGFITNFSQARNTCLRLASGTWILQIDADEILRSGHDDVRQIILREDVDVLGITLCNGDATWVGTRLYRADAVRGYLGRVHEKLDYSGRYEAKPSVVIENLPQKIGKESSSTRNLRLLRIGVHEDPSDSRAWFYLGNEERRVGAFDAAIEAYSRSIEGARHPISAFHARYYLAACYFLRERYSEALKAVDSAIETDPRYAEGYCLRADINRMLGNYIAAKTNYERALLCGSPPSDAVFAVSVDCYHAYPTSRLEHLVMSDTTQNFSK